MIPKDHCCFSGCDLCTTCGECKRIFGGCNCSRGGCTTEPLDTGEKMHTVMAINLDLMEAIAAAMGDYVVLGVRGNGTWFIHCDSVEIDGPPELLIQQLRDKLAENLRQEIADLEAKVKTRKTKMTGFSL